MKLAFNIIILMLTGTYCFSQETYKVTLFRAAPGHMLELLEDLKTRAQSVESSPLIIRHSQGDHWDYLILEPVGSFSEYFISNNEVFTPVYGDEFYDLVSFHEQVFMTGPERDEFIKMAETYSFFHVEMFVALAGKQNELLEERKMENVYLNEIGRNQNLIFTSIIGSSLDSFTLGGYRDIKHFAESADISIELEESAALKAGFKGVTDISPYLRSLISKHNDTLGNKVSYLQVSE